MNEYAFVDIVLTVLVVLLVVRAFTRGFIKEFFSLGAPVLGVVAGFLFYRKVAALIRTKILADVNGIPEVLGFVAAFLAVFIICKIIQKILADVIRGMKLDSLDKLLGGIFGVIEGILAMSIVLFIISVQPLFDPAPLFDASFYGRIFVPLIIEPSRAGLGITPRSAAMLVDFLRRLG